MGTSIGGVKALAYSQSDMARDCQCTRETGSLNMTIRGDRVISNPGYSPDRDRGGRDRSSRSGGRGSSHSHSSRIVIPEAVVKGFKKPPNVDSNWIYCHEDQFLKILKRAEKNPRTLLSNQKKASVHGNFVVFWLERKGKVAWSGKQHLGEFDPVTGAQAKPANPTRKVEK